MNKKIALGAVALLFAPSLYAEDSCSGTFANTIANAANAVEVNDNQLIFVTRAGSVASDNSPLTGDGGCAVVVHKKADKGVVHGTCTRVNASGDSWTYVIFQKADSNRGKWQIVRGTGEMEKLVGSSGWYEQTAMDENSNSGKWGGNCNQ